MPRNRQLTESRIQDAATRILKETGFEDWGINAIARKAGVDKVLIYRYFVSLKGLLDSIINSTEFWPDPDSLSDDSPESFLEETISRMRAESQAWVLMAHPRLNSKRSPLRQHFILQRDRWYRGLQSRVSRPVASDQFEQLAAMVYSQAISGIDDISPRDLWNSLSSSLVWRSSEMVEEEEDLPVELL